MKHKFIAIDGKSATGKTRLAESLAGTLQDAVVFHTSDYHLRSEKGWADTSGGLDVQKIKAQIIEPALQDKPIILQEMDPATQLYHRARLIYPPEYIILEGTGSSHPALAESLAFTVFLDDDTPESDPARARYLKETRAKERADMVL